MYEAGTCRVSEREVAIEDVSDVVVSLAKVPFMAAQAPLLMANMSHCLVDVLIFV